MKENHCIYIHIFPNNKVYIGQTKYNVQKRWGNKGYRYREQPLLYNAIKKYGWDNIEHKILCKCKNQEDANLLEKYYIKQYQSNNIKFGYNLTNGGDGMSGYKASKERIEKLKLKFKNNPKWQEKLTFKNCKHTEETKSKISNSHKGKKRSPELCKKMSEFAKTRTGNKNSFWNKHHNENTINKIREKVSNKILCIETGQVFLGCREAGETFNVKREAISKVVNGQNKTCQGYHFIKLEKEKNKNE